MELVHIKIDPLTRKRTQVRHELIPYVAGIAGMSISDTGTDKENAFVVELTRQNLVDLLAYVDAEAAAAKMEEIEADEEEDEDQSHIPDNSHGIGGWRR